MIHANEAINVNLVAAIDINGINTCELSDAPNKWRDSTKEILRHLNFYFYDT